MTATFDRRGPLIVVQARLIDPTGAASMRLALDTGASLTSIRQSILAATGYDMTQARQTMRMATAGGLVSVPLVQVQRIEALG
jgi:predicted aspartyl protease